jgi:hypothetical protein
MKILAIRQEGTESTGAMLFVDLETEGRFGPIEVTYELDPKVNGKIIGSAWIEGKPVRREPTLEEHRALAAAHSIHRGHFDIKLFPVNVTFEPHEEHVLGDITVPAGITTVLT